MKAPELCFHGGTFPHDHAASIAVPAFFTDDIAVARLYAQGSDGMVTPARLSLSNPLDISTRAGAQALIRLARAAGVEVETDGLEAGGPWACCAPAIAEVSSHLDETDVQNLVYLPPVREALRRAGHDGLYGLPAMGSMGVPTWTVLRPEQVREVSLGKAAWHDMRERMKRDPTCGAREAWSELVPVVRGPNDPRWLDFMLEGRQMVSAAVHAARASDGPRPG